MPPTVHTALIRRIVGQRWWVYQRERFPLLAHGPLIAAFSGATLGFSALLRDATPDGAALGVGFCSALIFFFQLRVSDEFKDYADDLRYRPYRPVPRGLVTLAELRGAALLGAAVQLLLALWLDPRLLLLLLPVWGYMALMHYEFGVPRWLKARPLAYLLSHLGIVPLMDFYVSACDWLPANHTPPALLFAFLATSLCNGAVIELGRKIRAPEDEEPGVETYSALWGLSHALCAWWIALALAACFALAAGSALAFAVPRLVLLLLLLLFAVLLATQLVRVPSTAKARRVEWFSGAWVVLSYGSLGLAPLLSSL
jgi:4-hydroxybenzoate polyprenyltransferase